MLENNNPLIPDYVEVFYAPMRDNMLVDVLLVAVCMLILLDLIFGMAAAAKNGEFESSKVRQGLWHKTGELALIMLAMIVDALILSGVTVPINIPNGSAIVAVCTGLAVMEISSLLEIAVKLNDQLAHLPVFKMLASVNEGDSSEAEG